MEAPKIKIVNVKIVNKHNPASEEQTPLLLEYKKNKPQNDWHKAGACAGVGAGLGFIKGGSLGIAAFGGAIGAPLWLAGAVFGLAGYGLYKGGKAILKEMEK